MWEPDTGYPANDLIGRGFKNLIFFPDWNDPVGDESAEFKIILQEPAAVKTAFIINYCYTSYRFLIGTSEMRVGYDREDFTLNNPVVASGIVDGGFQTFSSPLKLGDVVTFRRNGPDQ